MSNNAFDMKSSFVHPPYELKPNSAHDWRALFFYYQFHDKIQPFVFPTTRMFSNFQVSRVDDASLITTQ